MSYNSGYTDNNFGVYYNLKISRVINHHYYINDIFIFEKIYGQFIDQKFGEINFQKENEDYYANDLCFGLFNR